MEQPVAARLFQVEHVLLEPALKPGDFNHSGFTYINHCQIIDPTISSLAALYSHRRKGNKTLF